YIIGNNGTRVESFRIAPHRVDRRSSLTDRFGRICVLVSGVPPRSERSTIEQMTPKIFATFRFVSVGSFVVPSSWTVWLPFPAPLPLVALVHSFGCGPRRVVSSPADRETNLPPGGQRDKESRQSHAAPGDYFSRGSAAAASAAESKPSPSTSSLVNA